MARVVTMLLLLMLAAVVPAAAQEPKKLDPVIVTGTKIETPAEQVGATVTVIDGDEIETRHYPTVDEALRNVPGVEIRRSGSLGKTTSISIRGANPNQVQILVDGVRVKSPTLGHGRPGRHRARRRSSGSRSSAGRSRRSTAPTPSAASCNIITKKGQRAGHRVRVAGGRQLRHLPQPGGRRAARGRRSTTRSATTTSSPTGLPSTTAWTRTRWRGRFGLDLPWGDTRIGGAVRYNKTDTGVPIEFVGNPLPIVPTIDPNTRQESETYTASVDLRTRPVELVGGRDPRVPLLEQAVLHRPARSLHVPAGDLRPALRFPRHASRRAGTRRRR